MMMAPVYALPISCLGEQPAQSHKAHFEGPRILAVDSSSVNGLWMHYHNWCPERNETFKPGMSELTHVVIADPNALHGKSNLSLSKT